MTEVMHLDFETRSQIDLRRTGVYVYAKHSSTDLWCACYGFDSGDIEVWVPGEECPDALRRHVESGGLIAVHNANFERIIWKHILTPRYGWPEPAIEQWRDTMVQAYAMALPGNLKEAAPAAGLDIDKDMSGHRLMLQMAKPRRMENGEPVWWDVPEKIEKLIEYCKQDVEVERQLYGRLRPLKESEQALWFLDQRINDRGVFVDEELCNAAKKIVAATTERLDLQMSKVTGRYVSRCSNRNQLVTWVRDQGVECESIAKKDIDDLLEKEIPENVREALLIRRESAKASVAKIDALLRGMCPDGRARGLCQFHAASTGRWAGRRFQPQNLKRPELETAEEIDQAIGLIMDGDIDLIDTMYGAPLSVVGDAIRGMVKAPAGRKIVAADYSAIEGRVLAWLAEEDWKVKAYRDFDRGVGEEMYKLTAAKVLRKAPGDITKLERQNYGKVPELAMGYQGGVGAFSKMAANYGIDLTEDEIVDIRDSWREANPAIRQFWYDLGDAAMRAVENPGSTHWVGGKIVFRMAGSFLWMRLPSKRFLAYAYPEIRMKEMPWTDDAGNPVIRETVSYKGVNSYSRKWERNFLYGGHLAENATQAVARDFMAHAMVQLEEAGYEIVLTVHDEIVTEVADTFGSVDEMVQIMTTLPAWGDDCPITAEGWEGERYRK